MAKIRLTLPLLLLAVSACGISRPHTTAQDGGRSSDTTTSPSTGPVVLERITTAVPWPRGVRHIDGKLYALARGVHRSAGGPQASIEDLGGTIFRIDPKISEPATDGQPIGAAVRGNAEIVARPDGKIFHLWNRVMPATEDIHTDRPYCMLVYDAPSQNFFVCGYSGIDLAKAPKFRKNATDAVHRYDMRSGRWMRVEQHDPNVVPRSALRKDVSSIYYPHHDPATNAPPHGLVNGPCGAVVAGDYLYVGAKDNTALACYDLRQIRKDPNAPPPPGHYIFEGSRGHAEVQVAGMGTVQINGTCALTVHEGFLYVAFRTTSQILRFPLTADGQIKQPMVAELVAQFPRYDPVKGGGSANIYDMCFDKQGRLYVSPGYDGAIYRFRPDPEQVFRADEKKYTPYVDLKQLVGAKKSGNICFDDEDNLYICCGQKVLDDSKIRGVIYRVRRRD